MSISRTHDDTLDYIMVLKQELKIKNDGVIDKIYIRKKLAEAWIALRMVQRGSRENQRTIRKYWLSTEQINYVQLRQ